MSERKNEKFEIKGVNHLALTCKDMQKTVDFYAGVLGMPLIKTIDLPRGMGQHFFFDIGNGDSLAFFWFPDSPESAPGVTHPENLVGQGSITTANASMNHIAFNIDADKIEEYRERLIAASVEVTNVINHDDSPEQAHPELTPSTFVRSIYFMDPDGIQLEFAGWARELTDNDISHKPATHEDRPRYLAAQREARQAAE